MARKMPVFRKQIWAAISAYTKELNKEYKRNGTIEGKALGDPEDAPTAQRALTRIVNMANRKAEAEIKERTPRTRKATKKAGKKKTAANGRKKRATVDAIPLAQ